MPERHIFWAAHRGGKTYNLVLAARHALLQGTSPHQMLALAAQRGGVLRLRPALEDGAGTAIPTTSLRQRALRLLQDHPAASGLPLGWSEAALLSGIDRRMLIGMAWARAAEGSRSLHAMHADQPGALDWVALLFERFADWSGTGDPNNLAPIEPKHARLHELWRAYREYLALCRQHGVVAFNEALNRASDALRVPTVRRASQPAVLLLDDIDLFQPAELHFAGALAGDETAIWASSASQPSAHSLLASERQLYTWAVHHGLHIGPGPNKAAITPDLRVAEYASPDDEAQAIADEIAARPPADGDWSRFALVVCDGELPPLLQRALSRRGVPVDGGAARDGYSLALARLAGLALKLLGGLSLSEAETIAMLRDPALRLPTADAHAAVVAVQEHRWQPFTPGGRLPDEIAPAARERIKAIESITATLREAPGSALERLRSWLAQTGCADAAWQRSRRALADWALAIDRQHWERLCALLEQAESLRAALGTPLSAAEASEVWTSAQALIPAEGQADARGVRLWSPGELGGRDAERVWIAGLHENALPRPNQSLPHLLNGEAPEHDADDVILNEGFGDLPAFVAPQSQDRAARWAAGHAELERMIGRATLEAMLSYSWTDRSGRRRLPSPIMTARMGITPDRHGRLNIAGMRQPQVAIPANSVASGTERAAAASVQSADAPFVVSPSMLEDYVQCPRRCFFARKLGLYDVASSPRQALGQVVHGALQDLLRDAAVLPPTPERAMQLVAEHWIADEQRWGSRLKARVFRQLAEQAVIQAARYEQEAKPKGTSFVGSEVGVRYTLPGGAIVIEGRVDRIDRDAEGLHVIDYKLGRNSSTIKEILAEFIPPRDADAGWRPADVQLPIYALALEQGVIGGVERLPGERVASVALMYPLELYSATGKLSAKGLRRIEIVDHGSPCAARCEPDVVPPSRSKTSAVCREQLAAVEAEVRVAVAGMQAGRWDPDPRDGTTTCARCNFRPICPDPR